MTTEKNGSKTTGRKLYKSRKDKVIDGVCAGVAEYFSLDVTLVRIIWVLLVFFNGFGLLAYVAAMIVMQANPEHVNLAEDEKVQHNSSLFWGVLLVILGGVFLLNNFDIPYRFYPDFDFYRIFPYHSIGWGTVLSILLIGLGVYYIFHVLNSEPEKTGAAKPEKKARGKLYKSSVDKKISGVCGGIARHFEIDATLVRLGFVIFALMGQLVLIVIAYVLLAVLLPQDTENNREIEGA